MSGLQGETMNTGKNLKLLNCDTDSIMVSKQDETPFTEQEQSTLLKELNAIMPARIKWEQEGVFTRSIILKAKNYILYDGKTIKYRGSAVKATVKEKALQEFIKALLDEMLNKTFNFLDVYHKYILEINNIKDITRWASKKTITAAVLAPKRTNEQKVKDAIEGGDYVEGDKAYFFYKEDETLCLVEKFDGDYDRKRLLKKLHSTTSTFSTVIDKSIFLNYTLKSNQEKLTNLLESLSDEKRQKTSY